MHKGQVCMLKIKPSYGYRHPDCSMEPPSSVPADEPLSFEMQLLEWYPAARVRVLPLANGMYRRTVKDGTGWESPRPPFEVSEGQKGQAGRGLLCGGRGLGGC